MDKATGGRAKKAGGQGKSLPYQEPHQTSPGAHKLLEESIGREVKRFREKLNLTISEVAKTAHMSAGMLSKIENGATCGRSWRPR